MMPYIYLFIFSLLCASVSLLWRDVDKYISYLLFIILVLFIGLRYESVDYYGYWTIYDSVSQSGLEGFSKEKGFAYLMQLEQALTGHFFWFMFFFSLLSLFIKYKAIGKFTPYISFALFLYVSSTIFWKDLGQIRNGFIAGLILYAVFFSYKKQYIKFFVVLFLACQIHLAAIVGGVIYFINLLTNKKIMYFLVIFSFGVALAGGVGKVILTVIPIDALGAVTLRANSYLGSDYDVQRNILGISSLVNILLTLFLIYHYDKLIKKNNYNSYLIPLVVLGLTADYLLSDFGILGARIFDIFYYLPMVILLTYVYELVPKNHRWITYIGFFVYALVGFGFSLIDSYPYKSILNF